VNNAKSTGYSSIKVAHGFTLIELIIVIIILGILSVTVMPKFFTSKGFSEYAYRTDVIAKLRLIQTKAMQQTDSDVRFCHRVLVTAKKLGAPEDCDASPNFATQWQDSAARLQINSNDDITFSTNVAGNSFTFDSMGRPSCGSCTITISGVQSVSVKIESEGYIHAL
jgi:MSHA pilin protein MshC